MAGGVYAFLDLYRATGDEAWLRLGKGALKAVQHERVVESDWSLFRGRLGAAVAELDLEFPAHAAMPVFGDAGG
jgi:hypothetical protein